MRPPQKASPNVKRSGVKILFFRRINAICILVYVKNIYILIRRQNTINSFYLCLNKWILLFKWRHNVFFLSFSNLLRYFMRIENTLKHHVSGIFGRHTQLFPPTILNATDVCSKWFGGFKKKNPRICIGPFLYIVKHIRLNFGPTPRQFVGLSVRQSVRICNLFYPVPGFRSCLKTRAC